ncbi:MAG TPA: biotin carboxylase N-terminal domain-containing protein [Chloroflexota bacterium]|nr:biotin carboxylase N-terminal domain-containing protein [Chloroflexota bacterium]
MFRKVLIANRGEIAVRIVQACQELGARAVAVYSEADRDALHVVRADEAICIGLAPAAESYLNIPRIIEAARASGAEAVHPGYGFLAENPAFAAACAAAELVFVGPSPAALRLLGDKAAAKRLAQRARVPVVPGYQGTAQAPGQLLARARAVGFPLLIKAVAGGGGRGMRRVESAEGFSDALAQAQREAQAAFGDTRVLLERDLTPARHVEVQFLADRYGQAVAIGERDCSVQRRHQKLVEEAPAPGLAPTERARLGRWAVRLARAAGYVSAGTAEFLRDAQGQYYFLEVNARLQVEHPVTELVYGVDLVHWQLRIAAGERLTLRQAALRPRGHAVEVRLYAEDPAHGFQPTPGPVERFAPPLGPGLRHDVGVRAGDVVSRYYDTLLAKLIVHASDRDAALARLVWALRHYVVQGLPTNQALLLAVAEDADFRAAHLSTDFLDQRPALLQPAPVPTAALWAAAAADLAGLGGPGAPAPEGPWAAAGPWRGQATPAPLYYLLDGALHTVHAHPLGPSAWTVRAERLGRAGAAAPAPDEAEHRLEALATDGRLTISLDGAPLDAAVAPQTEPPALLVQIGGHAYTVARPPPPTVPAATGVSAPGGGAGEVRAPTAAVVVAVHVRPGAAVVAGQPLVALEAMKIEQTLTAPRPDRVRAVRCAVGDSVAGGALLIELEGADDSGSVSSG